VSPKAKTTAFFESSTPVQLIGSCRVISGSQATPPMNDLSYPFRKPLLIDEVRFTLNSAMGTNLGALVYAKLSLGQKYLMRDPVPVASLSTFMSLRDEEQVSENYAPSFFSSHYRWRLPEPLYVEAGQFILPVFSRATDEPATIRNNDITAFVTFAGRTVPPTMPRPKVIPVPYAAPFVTARNPTGSYVQSNERHLLNPFDKPLQIQRMTGRYYLYTESAPGIFSGIKMQTGITPGPANAQNLTVRLNDSWGGKMVNNFTGPADVWDIQRAAWTVDTMMPPKGMYEAQVWNIPTNTVLHLAMIGTREEAL
jgi:hypothetical protein